MTVTTPNISPDADVPETVAPSPAGSAGAYGAVIGWAIVACLLTLVNRFAGWFVPIPPFGTVMGHLLALAYLAAILFTLLQLTYHAARLPLRSGPLIALGVALALPMATVLLLQYYHLPSPLSLELTANNLFLPIAAALAGAGIGRIIKHPNTLIAGAGFATFFDFVVVTIGPVAQLMKSKSNIIAAVSLGAGTQVATNVPNLPAWMRGHPAAEPITGVTIGPADVLFLALFQAAVYQLRLSSRATFWWMFGLLMLALALVDVTSLRVPALVPMGVAVLIANARHAAFTKTEKRDLVIGAVFAVFCAGIIVYVAQRTIPQGQSPGRVGFTIGPVKPGEFYVGPVGDEKDVAKGSLGEAAGIIGGDQVLRVNGAPTGVLFGNNSLYPLLDDIPKNGLVLRVRLRDTSTVTDVFLPPARELTAEEKKRYANLPRTVRPK